MTTTAHANASRGAIAISVCFLAWGLMPIYWKQLSMVSGYELVAHRVVWSLLFLLGVLAWQKALSSLQPVFADARIFATSLLSGLLLGVNWVVFIWGIDTGRVIEVSLGYFLTPICNVAIGFLFFHERLRAAQWAAVAFAVVGVGALLFHTGSVPWIALGLAVTWTFYGILKKHSRLNSITGVTVETLLLAPAAGAMLLWKMHLGSGALGHVNAPQHALILASGVVTTIPLMLFAYGAKRLRFVTIGLLQYISPTVQFLLGLFLFHEPFDAQRLQAYVLIWCGLVLYSADSFWMQRGRLLSAATTR